MSLDQRKRRIFKPQHTLPDKFWVDYILLPYGEFYEKTKSFLSASKGDTLRFFNGPDVEIDRVVVVDNVDLINLLCRMRYGITWDKAFSVWQKYARLEGNGKDILSSDKCIMVAYNAEDTV